MTARRISLSTLSVLTTLLADPATELYGLEIAHRTDLLPSTTYPILGRLHDDGWVRDRWEDVDPHDEQRPPRRYYRLTEAGVVKARDAIRAAQQQLSRYTPMTATGAALPSC
jgi:DNA-binding PadR family transcriptional regulator